ncbi:hypothetical protein QE152_g22117 [Popillia japonica]|uniref:Uncharacterized protein n=1 Tax=Popillia japonica TaxID=7064 RepID=A0AAW1KMK6_POPJA
MLLFRMQLQVSDCLWCSSTYRKHKSYFSNQVFIFLYDTTLNFPLILDVKRHLKKTFCTVVVPPSEMSRSEKGSRRFLSQLIGKDFQLTVFYNSTSSNTLAFDS